MAQCDKRIDFRGCASRQVCGGGRNREKYRRLCTEGRDVQRCESKQHSLQIARDKGSSAQSGYDSRNSQPVLCQSTSDITSERQAPSAMRMPISRLLCVTV
jgi:hypothetical protein